MVGVCVTLKSNVNRVLPLGEASQDNGCLCNTNTAYKASVLFDAVTIHYKSEMGLFKISM